MEQQTTQVHEPSIVPWQNGGRGWKARQQRDWDVVSREQRAQSRCSGARRLSKACHCPILVHIIHALSLLSVVNMVFFLFSQPPKGIFFLNKEIIGVDF